MIQESLINSPLLAGIAITLIHFLWQGVLVALVLKLLLSLISYQKSQVRYTLASTAMLANLALPLITFFIVYDSEYRQATSLVQALPLLDQSFYLDNMPTNAWYIEWFEYLPTISIFWLSIVSLLSVKLLIELFNVNKLPLQGTLAAPPLLQTRFESLITKIGLSRQVRLLLSHKTDVPMAIGWLKPVVLIPVSMISGLTPQQLDMLMLHELAHIRRHDYLVNFLQTLVETLLFFHPTVRWVSKQMRNEREYCSDDIAVQHSDSALAYAHTLADTASLCQKHRHHAIPSMAMAASGGDLKQRVVRLLDNQPHCTQTSDSGKWLASFTILLVIIFGFSKYSLTLPIIDLQSGSISLSRSPVELNKSSITYAPLSLENVTGHSPLAEQLIAMNSAKTNLSQHLSKPTNSQENSTKQSVVNSSPTPKKQGIKKTTDSNHQITKYYDELPIVLDSAPEKNVEEINSKLMQKAAATDKMALNATKSISDIAFERTDSSNKSATFKNPYSNRVASLLNDPKTSNRQLPASKNLSHNAVDNKPLEENSYYQLGQAINSSFPEKYNNGFATNLEPQAQNSDAKLIKSIEPRYPSSAKRKGIELEIMVEFSIDKHGLVKDIQFESKSKVSYFRNAIRNAMEKWRFLPAEKNGIAVESKMSKIFSFSLLK